MTVMIRHHELLFPRSKDVTPSPPPTKSKSKKPKGARFVGWESAEVYSVCVCVVSVCLCVGVCVRVNKIVAGMQGRKNTCDSLCRQCDYKNKRIHLILHRNDCETVKSVEDHFQYLSQSGLL